MENNNLEKLSVYIKIYTTHGIDYAETYLKLSEFVAAGEEFIEALSDIAKKAYGRYGITVIKIETCKKEEYDLHKNEKMFHS